MQVIVIGCQYQLVDRYLHVGIELAHAQGVQQAMTSKEGHEGLGPVPAPYAPYTSLSVLHQKRTGIGSTQISSTIGGSLKPQQESVHNNKKSPKLRCANNFPPLSPQQRRSHN